MKTAARASLPTRYGTFEMSVYGTPEGKEHLALTVGAIDDGESVLVRVHSECLTGDVLGSSRCDCGEQLGDSLRLLQEHGRGVLLYLRQEGRGIGLTNKISAYEMLLDPGVWRVRQLTNKPAKIWGFERHAVVERVPLSTPPNPSNLAYLRTKREKMGHPYPKSMALEVVAQGSGYSTAGSSIRARRR